jgi:hypothetical protein
MTDSVRANGILSLVFRSFAEAMLERYAKAMWPTAYDLPSPDTGKNELNDLINLYHNRTTQKSCLSTTDTMQVCQSGSIRLCFCRTVEQ